MNIVVEDCVSVYLCEIAVLVVKNASWNLCGLHFTDEELNLWVWKAGHLLSFIKAREGFKLVQN